MGGGISLISSLNSKLASSFKEKEVRACISVKLMKKKTQIKQALNINNN